MSVKIEVRSRRYPELLFGWLLFHYQPSADYRAIKLLCCEKPEVSEVPDPALQITMQYVSLDWGLRITDRGREIRFLQCSIDDLPVLKLRDNFRPVRT